MRRRLSTLVLALTAACGGGEDGPLTPALVVEDQALSPANVVTVTEVSTPARAFVVFREDDGGVPGALLGETLVEPGVSQALVVTLSRAARDGERLHAILHNDTGEAGVFEFEADGTVDAPVTNATGDVVKAAFTVTVDVTPVRPEVVVSDQTLTVANEVVVTRAASPGPGFIVIHADDAGAPGAVLGHTALDRGVNDGVRVTLSRDAVDAETLYAMLHTDDGEIGTYEFDGSNGLDGPVTDPDTGAVIAPAFEVRVPVVQGASVTVEDQAVQPLDRVQILEVVAEVPGWLVVHEDDAGDFGAAIGHASVSMGTNREVVVELDREVRDGETLYAMLHVDDGAIGTYEFDGMNGLDAPVVSETGNIIAPPFVVSFEPQVVALDQTLERPSRVSVFRAIVDGGGWLVVRADQGGPGPVLGQALLQHGTNEDVEVALVRPVVSGETLYATLHTDDGQAGVYEFDGMNGLDAPLLDGGGAPVAAPFTVDFRPRVRVRDQRLDLTTEVVVTEVVSDGPGFIVIHAADGANAPGPVLGFTPLANGATASVAVGLDRMARQGERLFAMLHTDTGAIGTYEFTGPGSPDGPVLDEAGEVIAPPFTVSFAEVVAADQTLSRTFRVTVDAVTLARPGFVVIREDAGGTPGPIVGTASVAAGGVANVQVELTANAPRNGVLFAALHVDDGELGRFEFDGVTGLDAPVSRDGGPVITPFTTTYDPQVQVANQRPPVLDTVEIAHALSVGPGFLVVREEAPGGGPGARIGVAPLSPGSNEAVLVALDRPIVDLETLYAMLHEDTGTVGAFEFTGSASPDQPVVEGFSVIAPPFVVTR